jgi:hypothetical protein
LEEKKIKFEGFSVKKNSLKIRQCPVIFLFNKLHTHVATNVRNITHTIRERKLNTHFHKLFKFCFSWGGKGRPARKADNLTAICEPIV